MLRCRPYLENGKMKRLTLKKAWELCVLDMWPDIVAEWCETGKSIYLLKQEWLKMHGFVEIRFNCFFCEYSKQHTGGCVSCPAKKIDNYFSCCTSQYNYERKPDLFLKQIRKLHRLYLKGEKRRK